MGLPTYVVTLSVKLANLVRAGAAKFCGYALA
jgi:hypothetical protein